MEKILFSLAFALTIFPAAAKETVVAISPYQTQDAATQQAGHILTLFKNMDVNDRITVVDASNANTLAVFDLGGKDVYKHPRARVQHPQSKIAMGKLGAFIKQVSPSGRIAGAMDVPMLLAQIARNAPHATDIVLMGSAYYTAPTQKDAHMLGQDGRVYIPSDGLLKASPAHSPFGTQGREHALRGKRVHWLLSEPFKDGLHAQLLTRFWHLFIHLQGGELVSFSPNEEALMRLLTSNAPALPMIYALSADDKKVMQAVRTITQADIKQPQTKAEAEPQASTQPLSDKSADTQAPKQAEVTLQKVTQPEQPLTLDIEWDAQGVDLDIYAQLPGQKALSYRNIVAKRDDTVLARHFKDIHSGGAKGHTQYETIAFYQAVDVRALAVAVNVYRSPNTAQTINGTLRVQLAGKSYMRAFQFTVSNGNQGADTHTVLHTKQNSAHTLFFDVMAMMADSGQPQGV